MEPSGVQLMVDWFEVAAKALVYTATLIAVGAVTLRHVLLRRVATPDDETPLRRADDRADVVLCFAATGLVGALVLRACAHTVAAFGLPDALSLENLELIAIESRWGGGWQLQLAAGLLLLGTSLGARRRQGLQPLCLAAVVAVSLALPQTGHPAGHPWRVLLHATHVLGGGLWLGTLVVIVTAAPRALRPRLLQAFAPVATTGVGMVGLAGLIMSISYLGAVSALWTTDYGRELGLKGAVVGLALAMGAANWRALRRNRGHHRMHLPTVEASLLLVIVALTAWLSETAHP